MPVPERLRISHPPTPTRATTRELSTISRLHRAGTTSDDEASRPVMLEGVALLVDLIEQRNRGRAFYQNLDDQGEGGLALDSGDFRSPRL